MSKVIGGQIGWCWSEEGKAVLDDVTWPLPHRLTPQRQSGWRHVKLCSRCSVSAGCTVFTVNLLSALQVTFPQGEGLHRPRPLLVAPCVSLSLPVFLSPSVSFCLSLTLHLSLHSIKMLENVLKQLRFAHFAFIQLWKCTKWWLNLAAITSQQRRWQAFFTTIGCKPDLKKANSKMAAPHIISCESWRIYSSGAFLSFLCLMKLVPHTVMTSSCGQVASIFLCTKYCSLLCYQVVLLTLAKLTETESVE